MPVISTIAAATARAFGAFKAAAGGAADEFFNYVTLLLHGDGTNGAQNNTFLDSSTNNFTVTRNGNTTQGTFSPFSQDDGKWGAYFDGSGDYLSNIGTTSSFNFMHNTTALFTFECWVYLPSTAVAQSLIDNTNGTSSQTGIHISILAGGNIDIYITRSVTGASNVTASVTSTGTVPTNQWAHIAVTYDQSLASNNAKFYINGVFAGQGSKTGYTPSSSNASNAMRIGCYGAGTGGFITGSISNLRITNSIVYTSAFTPSTTPLTAITNTSLLTCQSNRFKDNSANAFAITVNGNTSIQPFSPFAPSAAYSAATNGGSGYFDGSGDYLAIANSSLLDLASTFSLEFWIYRTNGNNQIWISRGGGAASWSASDGLQYICFIESGTFYFQYNGGGSPVALFSTATLPALNAWTHIAVARNGTTTRGWMNGVSLGTSATAPVVPTTTNLTRLGTGVHVDYPYAGYMAGVRLLQGSAAYDASSSTITVPTTPPTAITNTSLLLNFTNAGILDNTGRNDLETVGNAQISTSVKKFGTGSLAFDGTGDYLVSNPASSNLYAFGTGDFTIEFWLYLNASGTYLIYDSRASGAQDISPVIYTDSGSLIYLTNNGTRISGGALATSTWLHIALSRSGTSTKMFVNGSQVGSTYTDSNNYINSTGRPFIGANSSSVGANSLNGYIDDLRITKGVARYTANFTPPTAAFPDL